MKTPIQLLENTRRWRKTPKGILTNIYQHQKNRATKYSYPITYSLEKLQERFLKDQKFLRLWKIWIKNGCKYYDKPSIDRINPYKGYEMNNIQILTWKENRRKGDKEVSIKRQKPIYMCDMDGKKLKRFNSIKEATIKMKLNQGLVSMVLAGQRTHTKGYKFIYENPELLK